MAALLETRSLGKVYRRPRGDVVALHPCDIRLEAAEAVAVTGPSGAGKSTLLNLLGGLDNPTSGCLLHNGKELDLNNPRRMAAWRNQVVGFIFQFHFLLPDFTALENLLIPVRMAGQLDQAATDRGHRLLASLGMTQRADHLPGELSGGEQQRVAVARAFMNRPEIVLADEPFGNLDREKGQQLGDLLFEMMREDGTSLVLVSHDLDLAARADRLLHIEQGRLVDGHVSTLGESP